MTAAVGLAGLLAGFGSGWIVQGLRWDSDVQKLELDKANALAVNVDAINQQLIASRAQTEEIRKVFLDYKTGKENETSELERAVATGAKRLLVKAACPDPVRAAGAVPGRAGEGTAELEHSVRSDYYALRREADRQYGELQFCRSELRKRSAK